MLKKTQRNGITPILLVGLENGTGTLESLSLSFKIKHVTTMKLSDCAPGHLSQRHENYVHMKICT